MIDEKLLDEVIPVPELDELKEEQISKLKEEGFVITNFNSGGIFYTLLLIILNCRIELIKLLRKILNNMFLNHAEGIWLEFKAADFSKRKKEAVKTKGFLTISRTEPGEAVKIPKASVFKTMKDINGEELRFFAMEDSILIKDALSTKVLVEAEKAGTRYNVPAEQISCSLVYLEKIDKITNERDWISLEGSDIEDEESLRLRTLNSWSELSTRPTAAKYKNVCETIEGVLYVRVDDQHPRGQGTVDIIVTSPTGSATEQLLIKVRTAAESIKGAYDNLLVKSSETVIQDISLILILKEDAVETGVAFKAKEVITEMFQISIKRNLNELILIDLIYALKNKISEIKNIKFLTPAEDILLDNDKVLVTGKIEIAVSRE